MAKTPTSRPGRNDVCHCGSGKKYKKCCLAKDEASDRAARDKAAAKAEKAAAAAAKADKDAGKDGEAAEAAESHVAPEQPRRRHTAQPWKRGATGGHGFQRISAPRKVGNG